MRKSRTALRLRRTVQRTLAKFSLLAPGDRVLVAISGGKDSWTMLALLETFIQGFEGAELIAVHLDQVQPGYDGAPLLDHLRGRSTRFEIIQEDTYSVVTEKLSANQTYCSLCSRLRRGILYTAAERLGCNKIALGHHRDDALETFLMNLFHAGRLQALPAKYTTDDSRFEVIRPLIECAEADIAEYATEQGFPILPCNLCGSQEGLQREAMAELLTNLESKHPNLRAVMLNALGNVSASHLLDTDLAELCAQSPRPKRTPKAASRPHARALPVISG
ncbi:MAG TPA: tRNA 2-thiocytidine(32) synthetase TtcA [Polyangiaceae bacterium]|nr:tRNA 2-thiocytidine(32) synthetase TtcA [Polyangiaceae bacterium]